MNQGRIWCVVSPSVGLPLLIGSVCVTSLVVHGAIMMNTTWYKAYYNGNMKKAALDAPAQTLATLQSTTAPAVTVSIAPTSVNPTGEASFTVTVKAAAQVDAAVRPPDGPTLASLSAN